MSSLPNSSSPNGLESAIWNGHLALTGPRQQNQGDTTRPGHGRGGHPPLRSRNAVGHDHRNSARCLVGVLSSVTSDHLRWRRDAFDRNREKLQATCAEFLDVFTQAGNAISNAAHSDADAPHVRALAARNAPRASGLCEKQFRVELNAPPDVLSPTLSCRENAPRSAGPCRRRGPPWHASRRVRLEQPSRGTRRIARHHASQSQDLVMPRHLTLSESGQHEGPAILNRSANISGLNAQPCRWWRGPAVAAAD